MKTVWEYSTKTEAERLLHCAHQIAVGFYRANNFIVLPYTPKIKNVNIVTFPFLPYNKIPRFWEKVKPINIEVLPVVVDPELLSKTSELLEIENLPQPNFEKIRKLWDLAQNEIISEIYKIIPVKKNVIKKITIFPTSFGTSSSFNFINKNGEIIIYLRSDQGITTITEAIITAITRKDVYDNLGGLWQESELLTDWLVLHSSISSVLNKYEPTTSYVATLKGTRNVQSAKLMQKSEEFYKKLGLPANQKAFSLNGLTPEIYKKPVENLTAVEKILLSFLIQKENSVATMEEIGDLILKMKTTSAFMRLVKIWRELETNLRQMEFPEATYKPCEEKGIYLKTRIF